MQTWLRQAKICSKEWHVWGRQGYDFDPGGSTWYTHSIPPEPADELDISSWSVKGIIDEELQYRPLTSEHLKMSKWRVLEVLAEFRSFSSNIKEKVSTGEVRCVIWYITVVQGVKSIRTYKWKNDHRVVCISKDKSLSTDVTWLLKTGVSETIAV